MELSSLTFNKDSLKENDTFTVSIDTKKLQRSVVEDIKTDCCGACGAILTQPKSCQNCGALHSSQNYVSLKEKESRMILLEKPVDTPDAPVTVFCVDCSGSMGGNRFNTVVAIMLKHIDELIANNPSEKVCVIGFGTEVIVYGDGTEEPKKYTQIGVSQIPKIVEKHSDIKSVSVSYESLKKMIPKMKIAGMTAGVSALWIATEIAINVAKKSGGKVEFFTDGISNQGIDEIQGIPKIRDRAVEGNILINVYSFSNLQNFMLPYAPVVEETSGNLQQLNNTYEEDVERVAPTLKTEKLGFNIGYNPLTTPGIVLCELPTNNVIIDTKNLMMHFRFTQVEQLKKRDDFYIQIQLVFINPRGQKVMYLVEKKCPFTEEVQQDNVAVILKTRIQTIYVHLTRKEYSEAKAAFQQLKKLQFNIPEDAKASIKAIIDFLDKGISSMNMSKGPSDLIMSTLSRLLNNNASFSI